MKILHCRVVIVVVYITCDIQCVSQQLLGPAQFKLSEDGRMTFPELATKYGHPADEHHVITDDGYNLTLYRIPGHRRRGVLLVHGNTPTADCWIARGNGSLAITLARQGYDVWALNLRGSRYSRRHVSLDPDWDSARFFNFSLYEQAVKDLPATIDYILEKTEQKQLLLIGHSSGTTLFYIMGAERPEYNDKIKLAISLAPVCYIKNVRGISKASPIFGTIVLKIAALLNINEFANHDQLGTLFRFFCLQPLGYIICIKMFMFALTGADEDGIEPDFINTLFGHWPGGSSRKTYEYLAQIQTRDKFAKFDYGLWRNLEVYGSLEPPELELSKVTMRSALVVGREDYLASAADVARLRARLPRVVRYQLLPYEKFTHMDFVWGRHMATNLYPYILPLIKEYI